MAKEVYVTGDKHKVELAENILNPGRVKAIAKKSGKIKKNLKNWYKKFIKLKTTRRKR